MKQSRAEFSGSYKLPFGWHLRTGNEQELLGLNSEANHNFPMEKIRLSKVQI